MYRNFHCDADDARATQPSDIKTVLKPHQLTSLQKMQNMERTNTIRYETNAGKFSLTEVTKGILADPPGYGKTLCMLALIANNKIFGKPKTRAVASGHWSGQSFAIREDLTDDNENEAFYVQSTIVVVPHGPVFTQWINAIDKSTTLTYLSICKSTDLNQIPKAIEDAITYLSTFDIIMISGTYYPKFRELHPYPGLNYWNRSVIDEAHSLFTSRKRMRDMTTKFAWFITATPTSLNWPVSSGYIRSSWDNLAYQSIKYLSVKNCDEYVVQSFTLPPKTIYSYLCKDIYNLNAVTGFASAAVMDMLNANDLDAAVHALRGREGDDVMTLIAKDVQIDINNRRIELDTVNRQTLTDRDRKIRTDRIQSELASLEERYKNIQERMKDLDEKECPICYEVYEDPVSLACTHVFCGECIMRWIQEQSCKHRSFQACCPDCKTKIDIEKIVRLNDNASLPQRKLPRMTKDTVVLKLINENIDSKFIIFSNHDGSFRRLKDSLDAAHISSKQLKGQSSYQNKVLEDFRKGDLRVIMLNSRYSGSGIDIHDATDVILYQKFDEATTQQVCARADRVGRSSSLKVHNLFHINETRGIPTDEFIITGHDE